MSKYLYDGEKLPALPGWLDQATYPYLLIYEVPSGSSEEAGMYLLAADSLGYVDFSSPGVHIYTLGGSDAIYNDLPIAFVRWKCNGLEWEQVEIGTMSNIYIGWGAVWSNTTLRDHKGNYYMIGTEPVPVPAFHLKSWLIGFALGVAGKPLPIALAQKLPVLCLLSSDGYVLKDVNGLHLIPKEVE